MNDDRRDQDGADGWVDPTARTEIGGLHAIGDQPPSPTQLAPLAHSSTAPKDPVEEGKMFAMLAHASVLVGIPLFVIPMAQRENEFALHHGKAAAVNFIFFMIALGITMISCGLLFPVIFLVYIPMIVGCVNAANGEQASFWAWGGIGERLFPGLQVRDDQHLLE